MSTTTYQFCKYLVRDSEDGKILAYCSTLETAERFAKKRNDSAENRGFGRPIKVEEAGELGMIKLKGAES
jgi:hypothetical protein